MGRWTQGGVRWPRVIGTEGFDQVLQQLGATGTALQAHASQRRLIDVGPDGTLCVAWAADGSHPV